MSPWLLNIFMDGRMREMKAKVRNVGARLKINGMVWEVVARLFALSEELQRMVYEFYSVRSKRKVEVNAGKSKSFKEGMYRYLTLIHLIG